MYTRKVNTFKKLINFLFILKYFEKYNVCAVKYFNNFYFEIIYM